MARENKPSIIFIDEVDALCGTRGEGESEASRRIKTEMLVQMDGVGKDSTGVLVLGATNIPWQLDAAIRRRFQKRVYIGLPDLSARTSMFKIAVGDTPTELKNDDFRTLAVASDHYSGSDISVVVQDALMQPVRKIQQATHFLPVSPTFTLLWCCAVAYLELLQVWIEGVRKLTPCSPGKEGALEMSWDEVGSDELLEPPVGAEDFLRSMKGIKPTVSQDELGQVAEWSAKFGSEG